VAVYPPSWKTQKRERERETENIPEIGTEEFAEIEERVNASSKPEREREKQRT
jgi:hypothetical protein